jgi:hypothetical protein
VADYCRPEPAVIAPLPCSTGNRAMDGIAYILAWTSHIPNERRPQRACMYSRASWLPAPAHQVIMRLLQQLS